MARRSLVWRPHWTHLDILAVLRLTDFVIIAWELTDIATIGTVAAPAQVIHADVWKQMLTR